MSDERFNPPVLQALTIYALLQFALLLAMTTQFLGMAGSASFPAMLAYAVYLVASLWVLGALMESRHWAPWLEGLRLLATALAPALSGKWFGNSHLDGHIAMAIAAVFGLSALALAWVLGRQHADTLPANSATG
jgi:hypothetical protein